MNAYEALKLIMLKYLPIAFVPLGLIAPMIQIASNDFGWGIQMSRGSIQMGIMLMYIGFWAVVWHSAPEEIKDYFRNYGKREAGE